MQAYYDLLLALLEAKQSGAQNAHDDIIVDAAADPRILFEELDPNPDFTIIEDDPCWTIEEACAYAVGLRPDIIHPQIMVEFRHKHWIAESWFLLQRYTDRALKIGDLDELVRPSDFWEWVSPFRLALAESFVGVFLGDAYDGYEAFLIGTSENDTSGREPIAVNQGARELKTRERKTHLKMIYALAINEIDWSPEKNTAAVQKLVRRIDLLSNKGLDVAVGERTIRDKLKAARDVVHGDD